MITIRKFQPSDFQSVVDIERKVFEEHDPYLYMQFYETYPEGFIVAEINGFVVGYVAGFLASIDTVRIFSLGVYPAYQSRGVGSSLLKRIIDVFREMGASRIVLEVRAGNIKARRFYEMHGFRKTGILEKYYNNAESACLMELEITD